jgi:uncharacterized protein
MVDRAVADTGPLVAIIRKREKAHRKCVSALKTFRPPLLTCWPVLTEASWLLRGEPGSMKALGGLVQSGSVKLVELDESALHWITAFMERYASANAQIADAAVMYIAEREGVDTVFTLDRRDFSIYRTTDGRALNIVPKARARRLKQRISLRRRGVMMNPVPLNDTVKQLLLWILIASPLSLPASAEPAQTCSREPQVSRK